MPGLVTKPTTGLTSRGGDHGGSAAAAGAATSSAAAARMATRTCSENAPRGPGLRVLGEQRGEGGEVRLDLALEVGLDHRDQHAPLQSTARCLDRLRQPRSASVRRELV